MSFEMDKIHLSSHHVQGTYFADIVKPIVLNSVEVE